MEGVIDFYIANVFCQYFAFCFTIILRSTKLLVISYLLFTACLKWFYMFMAYIQLRGLVKVSQGP